MTTMMNSKNDWTNSSWYKEWEQIARKDYHGNRIGYWSCYYNVKKELIYFYVSTY